MLWRNRVDVGGARQGDSERVLCVWGAIRVEGRKWSVGETSIWRSLHISKVY